MLDKELLAECIGIVKQRPSVTPSMVANELEISKDKAKEILYQLEDCCLIVDFGGFFASTDLAELN
jgi:ribosomal protein S25